MSHRVLVIGVGSIGERHLRCFGQTQRAEMWVCEPNPTLRERMQAQYAVTNSFDSLDACFDVPPDAAVICTPAQLHVPMAIRLAAAGVHLLIEKPLSTSLDQVDELTHAVRHRNLCASVAYVLRNHPAMAEMRDAVVQRRFGEPVQLVMQAGQHFPFFRPAYREIYYASHETGGGAIQDALTHGINLSEWFVGPITELTADADHQVLDGVEVEDTVHVIARHGPVMASYSLNQYQAANEFSLTVVCTDGVVRGELHKNCWSWQQSPEADWTLGGVYSIQRDELFVSQADRFLDSIEHGSLPLCSLDEAIQTLRVNLAIQKSVEQRRWQSIANADRDLG